MKTILLDGSHPGDSTAERARRLLLDELQERGWDVEYFLVREQAIGNCAGDFFCWIRSPGMCNSADDNRKIAAAIANSDLLIYFTPVTFGGYSSALKRMVDHQIQNVTPFFARVNGEVHHQKRYDKYPDFLVIGWMDSPDAPAEAVFRHLAWRNALNFYARSSTAGILYAQHSDGEMRQGLQSVLAESSAGRRLPAVELPAFSIAEETASPLRRAVLLVGSPRTRKSTSQSLGGYVCDQLAQSNVQVETLYIHTTLRSEERMQALVEAVDSADLVLLAFPLYVDSLPGPLIEALERIAAHRQAQPSTRQPRLAVIVNCGFPEAQHNLTAISICATFARQAGFAWAGALSLGAGEGLVHGTPLDELDGRAAALKASLNLAADSLAMGGNIPPTAAALMARPIIPGWLYILMGAYGWKQQAKQFHVEKVMMRKPYQE